MSSAPVNCPARAAVTLAWARSPDRAQASACTTRPPSSPAPGSRLATVSAALIQARAAKTAIGSAPAPQAGQGERHPRAEGGQDQAGGGPCRGSTPQPPWHGVLPAAVFRAAEEPDPDLRDGGAVATGYHRVREFVDDEAHQQAGHQPGGRAQVGGGRPARRGVRQDQRAGQDGQHGRADGLRR